MKKSLLLISALLLLLSCSSDKSKNHENHDLDGVPDSDCSSDIDVISDNDNNISDDDIIADLDETEDSDNIEDADIIEEADDFEEPLPDIDDNYEGIFADPELVKCVERYLPQGTVLTEEILDTITVVEFCDNEVTDIRGIEKLTNLSQIAFTGYANIKDYRPLARLKNLKILSLRFDDNKPIDIKTLIGPESLEEIDIYDTNLESFDNAKYFPNMKKLSLCGNKLDTIPLDINKMPLLEELCLGDNPISLLEPLKFIVNLKNLTSLYVGESNIKDLKPLQKLKNLAIKNLGVNDIKNNYALDLTPISEFSNLETLYADNSNISSIPPNKWENLQIGNFYVNKIENIDNLVTCKKLHSIDLGDNLIKDVSVLSTLPKLRKIWFSGNQVETIPRSFENLSELWYLLASSNNIRDISVFKYFGHLERFRWLNLARNKISDVSSLAYLPYLDTLEIEQNCIKDFSSLDNSQAGNVVSGTSDQKESCEQLMFLQEVF